MNRNAGCSAIALLTRHGKEQVLGPLFLDAGFGALTVIDQPDTDTLGTFTGEVARLGNQLEAARRKAQLAIEGTGLRWGLGSEGVFGPGPLGWGTTNVELVVLIDRVLELEVVGKSSAPGLHRGALVTGWEDAEAFAVTARFPEHGLVLRPDGSDHAASCKGVRDWGVLRREFEGVKARSSKGQVFIENDLRAHQHPSRMKNIERAARDVLARFESRCPKCEMPGFVVVSSEPGLRCRSCRLPTEVTRLHVWRCGKCNWSERRLNGLEDAEARFCGYCNP